MNIKKHRDSEISAQEIEETIRESRRIWDSKERLLEKVKRTVSQLEANLCMNCNKEISSECDLCNWNAYTGM